MPYPIGHAAESARERAALGRLGGLIMSRAATESLGVGDADAPPPPALPSVAPALEPARDATPDRPRAPPVEPPSAARPLTAAAVYAAHAQDVWKSLHRLGVRGPDLEDMLQEVFVVVHRRLDSYDGVTRLTTWLFGICLRVASAYRRRGYRRHEGNAEAVSDEMSAPGVSPEDAAARRQATEHLVRILDEMDPEKRAVFVMFELEQLPSAEIAELLGVPVGTVYSRVHAARRVFAEAAAKLRAGGAR